MPDGKQFHCKKGPFILWRRYRRTVEILQAAILTGLPFFTVNGQSAFRFDVRELQLYFFGSVIRINEFYLILAATLFFLIFITFVTAVFGRIWCGWLCPQTVLLDLTESISSLFGRKNRKAFQKIILLPFSALVALNLIWYFVPPLDTMKGLFVSGIITAFFISLTILVYLELAFLGRKFCVSVCPYSMLQNTLFDKDTLVIEYDVSRDDTCMKCDECVRACPVGIDIKKGLSTSCIACAECIDACYAMSSKRNLPPFPDYKGRLLRPKTYWLGSVTLAAGAILALLISARPQADFLVTRDQELLAEGLNRYSYTIFNNSGNTLHLELSASPDVTIIGDRSITVSPYAVIRGKVLIRSDKKPERIRFMLKGERISLSKETGFL
jgi:cytochrome c oxidase accessory protein FixG